MFGTSNAGFLWSRIFTELIVDSPGDFALAFDLETFGDSFELCDCSGRCDGTDEVREVGCDRHACARVPNDGARVCFGAERFTHASRSLKNHAKRRRMAGQVDVRKDFVGGGALEKCKRANWRLPQGNTLRCVVTDTEVLKPKEDTNVCFCSLAVPRFRPLVGDNSSRRRELRSLSVRHYMEELRVRKNILVE